MSSILVFGTILYDHIGESYYIGGCHTNVAAHCAKLGMDTTMISAVGKDRIGDEAVRWLADTGIRTGYVMQTDRYPTGTVEVDISSPESPEYVLLDDVAYDHIWLTPEQLKQLSSVKYDYMYYGTFEQRHQQNRETLRQVFRHVRTGKKFFDINLRSGWYTLPVILESLQQADILKVNEEELQYLKDAVLNRNYDDDEATRNLTKLFSIDMIVVTRSSKGASAYWKDSKVSVDAVPVQVSDSVGAGDAFAAGFLNAFERTGNIRSALQAGAVLGSYVAGQRAAVPEYTSELRCKLGAVM